MKELAAIYKKYEDKVKEFHDEFEKDIIKAGYDPIDVYNPFMMQGWAQISLPEPTEGAVLEFEADGTAYYTVTVDDVRIVEAVDVYSE